MVVVVVVVEVEVEAGLVEPEETAASGHPQNTWRIVDILVLMEANANLD